MRKQDIKKILLVFLLFLVSFGLILYPFIANYVFEHRTDSVVHAVEENAEKIDNSTRISQLKMAGEYNETLASGHVQLQDPFVGDFTNDMVNEYESLLCMTEDGVMGFVEIPSIDVSLPIYHGTAEQTLEVGAGHLEGSSLPIGGISTHSVITGHTGLSNAKLFTDLVALEKGDIFYLHIYGEKLVYEVDQIKTVLPYELEDLAIMPGKDYCTLVTCTPYGVNTHRLLVRGQRTIAAENTEEKEVFRAKAVESKWMQEYKRDLCISFALFGTAMILFLIVRGIQKHRKEDKTI